MAGSIRTARARSSVRFRKVSRPTPNCWQEFALWSAEEAHGDRLVRDGSARRCRPARYSPAISIDAISSRSEDADQKLFGCINVGFMLLFALVSATYAP